MIENKNKFFPILEKLKPESVLTVNGKVIKRAKGTENNDLETGKIEIDIQSIKFYQSQMIYRCQFLVSKITQKK